MRCPFCDGEHADATVRCPVTLRVVPRQLPAAGNAAIEGPRTPERAAPPAPPVPDECALLALRVDDELTVCVPLQGTVVLGRDEPSPIAPVSGDNISRQHAELRGDGRDDLVLTDLRSRNGTYVNNERVWPDMPRPLRAGDIVELANEPRLVMTVVRLVVRGEAEAEME